MRKHKQLMLMAAGAEKQETKIDFYRSLSVQGIYQTVCVAEKIKEDPCDNPEYIFASTALYARQTAEILHQTFPVSELIFQDNLYTTNEKNLLYFLKHLDDIFSSPLILADQQPIQKLTEQLIGQKPNLKASTCLCIHWPPYQSWKTIDSHMGLLIKLWTP